MASVTISHGFSKGDILWETNRPSAEAQLVDSRVEKSIVLHREQGYRSGRAYVDCGLKKQEKASIVNIENKDRNATRV